MRQNFRLGIFGSFGFPPRLPIFSHAARQRAVQKEGTKREIDGIGYGCCGHVMKNISDGIPPVASDSKLLGEIA